MNKDSYEEVINGQETYDEIAGQLLLGNNVMIGWTDEDGSHYDILFCYKKMFMSGSNIQGGINPRSDLFVSIMRLGAFSFEVEKTGTHYKYYSEKLGIRSLESIISIADLIEGIKRSILKMSKNS